MGYGQPVASGGQQQRHFDTATHLRGGAMATGGLLILIICAFLNAAVLGNGDTAGSLWFGFLIGVYMLAYGIVKRLSLTFLPRPEADAGSTREHHSAD